MPNEMLGSSKKSSNLMKGLVNATKCHDVANESFVCPESRLDETKESFGKQEFQIFVKCSLRLQTFSQ